jgi:hypothetical protein
MVHNVEVLSQDPVNKKKGFLISAAALGGSKAPQQPQLMEAATSEIGACCKREELSGGCHQDRPLQERL